MCSGLGHCLYTVHAQTVWCDSLSRFAIFVMPAFLAYSLMVINAPLFMNCVEVVIKSLHHLISQSMTVK